MRIDDILCFFFSSCHSYDTRGTHAGTPSHWKDEEILENRAIFRTVRAPAELIINPVKVCLPSFIFNLNECGSKKRFSFIFDVKTSKIILSKIFHAKSFDSKIYFREAFAFLLNI